VRVRLFLIAAALAILAIAGLRPGEPSSAPSLDSTPASSQLASEPAPDPALPAVITAAVARSASVQSQPAIWPHGFVRPAQWVLAGTAQPAVFAATSARPLTFPLLI